MKNAQNHLEAVLPSGDYRDDATLTTAANSALTLNIAGPDGVEATAKNGNMTLAGTVSYGTERTAAEQAVAVLTGVRNVKDDIAISTDADPLTLTGQVRTWAEHDAVVDAAWMATGVYDVRDDLYVTG